MAIPQVDMDAERLRKEDEENIKKYEKQIEEDAKRQQKEDEEKRKKQQKEDEEKRKKQQKEDEEKRKKQQKEDEQIEQDKRDAADRRRKIDEQIEQDKRDIQKKIAEEKIKIEAEKQRMVNAQKVKDYNTAQDAAREAEKRQQNLDDLLEEQKREDKLSEEKRKKEYEDIARKKKEHEREVAEKIIFGNGSSRKSSGGIFGGLFPFIIIGAGILLLSRSGSGSTVQTQSLGWEALPEGKLEYESLLLDSI
jgi:hypothetical protein